MTTDPVFDVDDINLSTHRQKTERVFRGMPSSRLGGRGSSMRRFYQEPQYPWYRGGFRVATSLHEVSAP